ncbi:hypothetical protein HNY73_017991 [Argiope bruennichi]|uniref:Uncharacterized protein n=1 Tax=Argiope bruennichi TaxID=94029 RepID=A0A8T0EER1_ARGBR|nr:hypothetical protein HNY73_017991 [Argiope bruennichi]
MHISEPWDVSDSTKYANATATASVESAQLVVLEPASAIHHEGRRNIDISIFRTSISFRIGQQNNSAGHHRD